MIAVCGKCNVPLTLHPVPQCPYEYKPVEGYGFMMTNKKSHLNGQAEEKEGAA